MGDTIQPQTTLQPVAPVKAYTITKNDLISIGKGLLIAVGGAALTYLNSVILKTDFSVHYGATIVNYTPIVYVFWSSVVNVGRKYLDGQAA